MAEYLSERRRTLINDVDESKQCLERVVGVALR